MRVLHQPQGLVPFFTAAAQTQLPCEAAKRPVQEAYVQVQTPSPSQTRTECHLNAPLTFYHGCKFTTIVVNLQPYGQMPESPTVATELPVQRALDPGGPGGAASGVRTRRGGRRRLPEVTEIDCGPEGRFSGRRVGTSAHQARPRRPPCGCGVGWACRRAAHISGAPYRR